MNLQLAYLDKLDEGKEIGKEIGEKLAKKLVRKLAGKYPEGKCEAYDCRQKNPIGGHLFLYRTLSYGSRNA